MYWLPLQSTVQRLAIVRVWTSSADWFWSVLISMRWVPSQSWRSCSVTTASWPLCTTAGSPRCSVCLTMYIRGYSSKSQSLRRWSVSMECLWPRSSLGLSWLSLQTFLKSPRSAWACSTELCCRRRQPWSGSSNMYSRKWSQNYSSTNSHWIVLDQMLKTVANFRLT